METLTELFESRVDAFLERTGLKPSAFGREATGDPNLMRQLRLGRSPTLATADRILAFIEAFDGVYLDPDPSRSNPLRDSSSRARKDRAMRRTIVTEVEVPMRIVRLPGVQARTGLSRSTIRRRLADGSFPKPVQLGARAVGWIEEEVDEWIRQQIAARRSERCIPTRPRRRRCNLS